MSGLGAWIWGTSQLDDAVDRATSELLPSGAEDIALNLEICDQIRSKSAPPKDAMRAIKRRLNHKNPNVQLLALSLSDVCVKNAGDPFLVEIASREFIDNLVSILKIPTLNGDVKNMILRLVQNWSTAFEGKSSLSYVGQVCETLKKEGYKFPPRDLTLANSAMTDTQTAPEWSDSDLCLGCRTPFTFTNRKHHCRNCGQVFDQACSSKTMPLPHYGITQEVRVCDGCFKKLTRKAEQARPPPPAPKKESRRHRPHGQDLEDAELQRAIELSLNETKGYTPSQPPPERWQASEPPIVDRSTRPTRVVDEEDDPDLKAAIEASLREASAPKASAPAPEPTSEYSTYQPTASALPPPPAIPHYELNPVETDSILTFNQTMEQVEAQGGRDLSRYPAVTDLYDKASGLRPKLALSLDDAGRKEELLTDMHSKLSEAVKLYDQILTHQVSQPRWRSAVASPSNAYQPATSGYHSTGYNNQWNAQMQPQATGSTQQTYAPAPPVEQVATQYASMTVSNEPQGQWAPQQQQYIASAPQMTPSAPAPVMSPPPTMIASPPPPPQFTTPSYMQQSAQYSSLPPVTFGQQQPASPIPIPQSPPPPPQQATSPAPSIESQASLTRSNTVAYASGPSVNQGLARSSTLGQRPVPQQYQPLRQQYQQQHYQQQQQLHQDQYRQSLLASAPAPPSAVLPSAPTAVPQFGSPYGVEGNQERKEALLIDL